MKIHGSEGNELYFYIINLVNQYVEYLIRYMHIVNQCQSNTRNTTAASNIHMQVSDVQASDST